MSGPDDLIPGKQLEKAAADVATDAGKSLVRGIARTLGAATAEWTAKREARADAARKAVETQAELDRANALTDARRSAELSEVEHQTKLEAAKRRADRMLLEMAHEQRNFEEITKAALSFIEGEPSDSEAGDLDEDWLFRFAGFAEQISDRDLQKIWGRVLRSASIKGKQKLSAASLFQLSLIEKKAALDFEKFCKAFVSFGIFPAHEKVYEKNALGIDIRVLQEHGLIQEMHPNSLQMNDVRFELGNKQPSMGFSLLHEAFALTNKGAEIANAIFGQELAPLSDEDQDSYLQDIITDMLRGYETVLVMPRASRHYFILFRPGEASPLPDGILNAVRADGEVSDRLGRLLGWAVSRYPITIHENSNSASV